MKEYDYYLKAIPEIGFVIGLYHSIVVVDGLPGAHLNEIVIFQNGGIGQVFTLSLDRVEVLILKAVEISVGSSLVRTGKALEIKLNNNILGKTLNSLAEITEGESFSIDKKPIGIVGRKSVEKFCETGVSLVDLIVPLGKGQRELVIGDRKTGKTEFLLQSAISHAKNGGIVVYAIIGQKQADILKRAEFFKD